MRIDIFAEDVYNISRKRAIANYIFIICCCSFLVWEINKRYNYLKKERVYEKREQIQRICH